MGNCGQYIPVEEEPLREHRCYTAGYVCDHLSWIRVAVLGYFDHSLVSVFFVRSSPFRSFPRDVSLVVED